MGRGTESGGGIGALWRALKLDLFTFLIVLAVVAASLVPIAANADAAFTQATNIAIALLFFLHGARLSRRAILAGLGHWRFHLGALALTFALFPLLGAAAHMLTSSWLTPMLAAGLMYLAILPSTIQSSITYTAMAGGNVPAAICSASLSNVVGVFVTPLLAALLIGANGAAVSMSSVSAIVSQILLPFALGHLARPWIGAWLDERKGVLAWFDRGVILAIVYRAFSAAMTQNVWSGFTLAELAGLAGIIVILLTAITAAAWLFAKALKFDRANTAALVLCGSQKSLASGAPMASILFSASTVGALLLPLMLYHQLQLMLGAVLARRFSK